MKYLVLSIILTIALLYPRSVLADSHEDQVHLAAHLGVSYLLTTFSYGLFTKAFHMDSGTAFVFAAVTTLAIGFTYKYMELMDGGTKDSIPRAMYQNTLGVLGSGFTIAVFKF